MRHARSFSVIPRNPLIGIALVVLIVYLVKGILLNCVLLDEKYPTRGACIQGQI